MITIVDYKMGNLLSIKNMLKKLGFDAIITSSPEIINNASKLILPGVGSFDTAMRNINDAGLKDILNHQVMVQKKPILGICLGMQLMCSFSEEGNAEGLNWINAIVRRFPKVVNNNKLLIPHIGWTNVDLQKPSGLFIPDEINCFYFVHSYYIHDISEEYVLARSEYGVTFCSAFQKENIIGVQFHPEKSHKFGMYLLKAFIMNTKT